MPHSTQSTLHAVGDIDFRAFAAALAETTEALVCVLDRDGRILAFNEACERATGRCPTRSVSGCSPTSSSSSRK